MAITFDAATTTAGADFGVTTVTSGTCTVSSNADRAAVIGMGSFTNFFGDTITVSFSGASASAIASAEVFDATGQAHGVKLFGCVNPGAGASKTATASWSTSSDYVTISAVTVYGANQTGGSTTFTGGVADNAASPNSVAVSSATGNLTVSAAFDDQGGTAPTSNQTRVSSTSGYGQDYAAGAASVTHTWTSAFAEIAVAGVNIVAAGGGGRTTKNTRAWNLGMEIGMNFNHGNI